MKLKFSKYQGAGNDFVMVDQRTTKYIKKGDVDTIKRICDRRFGIGADGLILLENAKDFDFEMVYFNSDGNESTMCGNGGRCIVAFAQAVGCISGSETKFLAIDGPHQAQLLSDDVVNLQMSDVKNIQTLDKDIFTLDTGSPHFVKFVDQMPSDIKAAGEEIRYSPTFKESGINVNFVKKNYDTLDICTYERGVENETLACGTGVTAAALTAYFGAPKGHYEVQLVAKGGLLSVSFLKVSDQDFTDIWLKGNATFVFSGEIEI
ncbi:MAG: diaminopimelate epimerase [Lewinellaceae bacterium]|nr:diaminopimelate epimerase [Lewinellaceae bacterium]